MSKLSKSLSAIRLILGNPWLLNKILDEDRYWVKIVRDSFGKPDGLPVIRAEGLFGDFDETIEPFAFLDGGSLPTDLALLKKLARRFPKCTYFEIGTWRGESVANVASVADKCFTFNLSDIEMKEKGLDQRYIDLHRFYSRPLPNVIHLEGNSSSFDFQSLNMKFDLIFIDGDHRYEMVKNDTAKIFSHLVHERSIVVWHDYARSPESVRFEVLAGILAGCPKSLHDRIFHIAHTLCAVYIPDYTGGHKLDPPVTPEGAFRVNISFRKTKY